MSDTFITLAIEQMGTGDFELWCQEVLSKDKSYQFEPTGGMHDGGQDGFVRSVTGETSHYVQISKEQDSSSKIRKTVKRLQSNRSLSKLTYVTSQTESNRDLLEAKLKLEFGIEFEIFDLRWLLIQAQLYETLRNSLFTYSKGLIDGLSKVKRSDRALDLSSRLSIVSYLETHVRSLPGTENFQNVCLDTLVYDALIDTDPSIDNFRATEDIRKHINDVYPNVLGKADDTLEERLNFLTSKANDPRVRKHPVDNFALPYSVRSGFSDGNMRIAGTSDEFLGSINDRFNQECTIDPDLLRPFVVSCVQDSIVETYRSQAMNFAASFTSRDFEADIKVFEIIRRSAEQIDVPADLNSEVLDLSATIYRKICYSANPQEQEYLNLLMKFFTIQFLMNGDQAVSQYFSDMATSLRVYVGTDIIVRCLSEALVQPSSRGMTNSLGLLTDAGVRLRVTRQTLGEVFSHIRHTTRVFRNDFEAWFRHATLDDVINSDRILIRSFFYAYLESDRHTRRPRDWSDYLRNFGAAAWFSRVDESTTDEYIDEFGSFLVDKFGLEFVEIDEVLSKIDESLAEKVCNEILQQRDSATDGSKILAMNDAQMALFVNSERTSRNERVSTNLYGFKTWWLTEETAVLRALRMHRQKDDVVMHPQFLMNHFILDPNVIKAGKNTDRKIMPTLFGLRITDRVPPNEMREFIRSIGDLAGLDESAQRARIRHAANKLKRKRPKY